MSTLHIVPRHDVIVHDISTDEPDCPCGPSQEPALDLDSGYVTGFLIIHHSLDDRE